MTFSPTRVFLEQVKLPHILSAKNEGISQFQIMDIFKCQLVLVTFPSFETPLKVSFLFFFFFFEGSFFLQDRGFGPFGPFLFFFFGLMSSSPKTCFFSSLIVLNTKESDLLETVTWPGGLTTPASPPPPAPPSAESGHWASPGWESFRAGRALGCRGSFAGGSCEVEGGGSANQEVGSIWKKSMSNITAPLICFQLIDNKLYNIVLAFMCPTRPVAAKYMCI